MNGLRQQLGHYPHHYHLKTRRSDSLHKGHVPNAVLANFADDAREGINLAFLGHRLYDPESAPSLVLGELGMRFLHEVTYPGPLVIGVGIARIGGSSMTQLSGIFRDGLCLVLGHCTMVRLGADRRPARFTEEERRRALPLFLDPAG